MARVSPSRFAELDLAWWALFSLEVVGWMWICILVAGYLRMRRTLRQIDEARALRAEKSRKLRQFPPEAP